MGKKAGKDLNDLRERAMAMAPDMPRETENLSREEILSLLHELQVYQIELELQNEDLREQQLAADKAQSRYFSLFYNAPIGYVILNQSGMVRDANLKFQEWSGLGKDRLVGSPFAEYLSDDDAHIFRSRYNVLIRTENSKVMEATLKVNSRRERRIQITLSRHGHNLKEPGEDVEILAAVNDITELQENRRRADLETKKAKAILESTSSGIVAVNRQGRITMANKTALGIAGLNNREIMGTLFKHSFLITDGSDSPEVLYPVERILKGNSRIDYAKDVRINRNEGKNRDRTFSLAGAPLLDLEGGDVLGAVVVLNETTERNRLMATRHQNSTYTALGSLAGGIAHNFNNLLMGLFGFVQLAQSSTDDPEITGLLSQAMESYGQARDLAQQLMTFSQGGEPQRTLVNMEELLRQRASSLLEGTPYSARYIFSDAKTLCVVDEDQFGLAVDNMIRNSMEAMPGRGVVTISLGREENNYVVISLSDEGGGIPGELMSKVFDPFYTTKMGHRGLGLSIALSIVQRHGGDIQLPLTGEKGLTLDIRLPINGEVKSIPEESDSLSSQDRIMVMDDDNNILNYLKLLLERKGFHVITCTTGEQAVGTYIKMSGEKQPPRAIFLDLTVPGHMGGKEAAKSIREKGYHGLMFAISGYSDDPVMGDPEKQGFDGSLKKPVLEEGILSLFRKFDLIEDS